MKAKRPTPSAEELLAGHTPPIRAIVEQLRVIVREIVPVVTERVYPGWHALGYIDAYAGYFAGIFPRAEHVTLVLEWGVALPDPDHVMTGNGSRTRNVDITDLDDIPVVAIPALLQEAINYGTNRRR